MKNNGFTFLELILSIFILGIGFVTVLTIYQRNISKFGEMEQTQQATFLAQEKMEQILADKKYNGYATIVAANYPASENLTGQGYPGLVRTIVIQEVRGDDLVTAQNGSGYKRLTVGVTIPGRPAIALEALVTEWGAQ